MATQTIAAYGSNHCIWSSWTSYLCAPATSGAGLAASLASANAASGRTTGRPRSRHDVHVHVHVDVDVVVSKVRVGGIYQSVLCCCMGGDEALSNALCECYMFAAGWVLVHPVSFRRPALDANTSSTLCCCMRRNSPRVFCLGQRLVIGTSGGSHAVWWLCCSPVDLCRWPWIAKAVMLLAFPPDACADDRLPR